MASRCRRAVKCRAKRYRPTFSAPARPPVRGLPQPLAPELRSQRVEFSFRTSFKLMRAQVRAGRLSGVRRGSADLSRHADRDRRATPFIPACATVNSVSEPQFWFERLIRKAIDGIACSRPIRFQTGGDGNVFQEVTHLISACSSAGGPRRYLRTENDRMGEVKRRVS